MRGSNRPGPERPPLPEAFVARVVRELGETEAHALCEALDGVPPVSVRRHPDKGWCVPVGAVPVPWCRGGYYLPERPLFTFDPAFHGGAYYVQEAGSQFVDRLLACCCDLAGRRVLDLCAAPGGKTTLYASLAGPDGLVVANEIDRSRARTLADNVRKWGTGNVVVTTNTPAEVASRGGGFDVVAVDAPCSGEGMFRKDPAARREWSEGNVRSCARRQAEILREAWRALRAGGTLLYSTCTFSRAEDEEVLAAFGKECGAELVEAPPVETDPAWGVLCGRVGVFRTFRFHPHRTRSEGFFAAVACKSSDAPDAPRAPKARRTLFVPATRDEEYELARWVQTPEHMRFVRLNERFYALPESQAESLLNFVGGLTAIASGVELGVLFGGRLKPAPALAFATVLAPDAVPVADLPTDEALRYLRCQEVAPEYFAEGLNLVRSGGTALGWVKRMGRRVNNLYPRSLRILKNE